MTDTADLRPMSEFDPDISSEVFDDLNKHLFTWEPRWAAGYRKYGLPLDAEGHSGWDGFILVGWRPLA